MTKKLFQISLGCSKNLVDSEVMLGLLSEAGYEICEAPEDADLLLVNTCGFIQPAVEEAIDEILAMAEVKKADPNKKLVVTGCLVQRYRDSLAAEIPEVDCFIGTDGFQDILLHLAALGSDHNEQVAVKAPPSYIMDSSTPRRLSTPGHRAFLKITEGCINRCTYCMIPSIRGTLRSREIGDIVKEAQRLEAQGVKEICLIAQDLTAFGLDRDPKEPQLLALLKELLTKCDIPWFRLLYLHPKRVEQPLLDLMAANPRLLPYLDIPVQHVSDRILKLMNRPYDRQYLTSLFANIRRTLPDIAIRTTLMVGFPGETEAEVSEMEAFLREQQLDHVGIFTYSNEEGCAAANLPDHCPEEEMGKRRDRLMAVQAEISTAKNQQQVGKKLEVLVEGISGETDLLLEGRSRYQAPEVDGTIYIADGVCAPGDLVQVQITESHTYDLVGEIVS